MAPSTHWPYVSEHPVPQRRPVTRRAIVGGLGALALAPAVSGCGDDGGRPTDTDAVDPPRPAPLAYVDLPEPAGPTVALETALRRRRSAREFATEPLTTAEIGQLLWAAQGVTADWGGRTAPSAGALYPLELYALTETGTMGYLADGHRGAVLSETDVRADLVPAAFDQDAIGRAPLVVAVVGVPARTAEKYGDRALRYVDLEAGHAAQNLLLQAAALDLAAVPVGGFDDEAVGSLLDLPAGEVTRYLIAVGHPPAPAA